MECAIKNTADKNGGCKANDVTPGTTPTVVCSTGCFPYQSTFACLLNSTVTVNINESVSVSGFVSVSVYTGTWRPCCGWQMHGPLARGGLPRNRMMQVRQAGSKAGRHAQSHARTHKHCLLAATHGRLLRLFAALLLGCAACMLLESTIERGNELAPVTPCHSVGG